MPSININKKPKKWDPVFIAWLDAFSSNHYQHLDDPDLFKPMPRRTLGWYLGKKNGYVCVSMTDDTCSHAHNDVDQCLSIPVKMIEELIVLKAAPRARR